jgi:hypothetical protein
VLRCPCALSKRKRAHANSHNKSLGSQTQSQNAHCKVEAKHGDAFGQHVEQNFFGIPPAPAVACTGCHMQGQQGGGGNMVGAAPLRLFLPAASAAETLRTAYDIPSWLHSGS